MATLLMVESWLHSTGRCLPPLLGDLGHRYVLLTRDPGLYPPDRCGTPHPVVRDADEVVVADTNDLVAVCDAAAAVGRRRRIDGVLTTCDYYLEAVARVAERLGLPGAQPAALRLAAGKHRVRQALDRAGLPNPAHAVAATWEEAAAAAAAIGYPLVAKPVDLNAGTAVRRVDDETGLKDAVGEIVDPERNTRGQPRRRVVLLEEMLTGQEISVEAVTVDGETTVVGITDKSVTGPPAFVESGHMFPARLDPGDARRVEAFVRSALAAVGYAHGLSHSEVMLTPAGPRLVEINPRQGGGYIFDLVELVTGSHPLETLVDLCLGRSAHPGTAARPRGGAGRVASAAVVFVMSPRPGLVEGVAGADRLDADPGVLRWTLPTPVRAPAPRDNEAYLGHVLAVDPAGPGARARAEAAVSGLRLRLAGGDEVAPLGVPSGLAT
jgi:argininosuccinate lyase